MFSPEHLTEGTSSPRGCKAWQTPELFNHILVLPHCAHELHLSKVLRSHALQTSPESSRPWMSKVCCRPTQALAAPRPKVQDKDVGFSRAVAWDYKKNTKNKNKRKKTGKLEVGWVENAQSLALYTKTGLLWKIGLLSAAICLQNLVGGCRGGQVPGER